MEISIGDYVRTDNGEIHKVEDEEDLRIHIKTEKIMFRAWVEDYYGCHKEDRFIVKHSKNIIDLIQEDDLIEIEYEISDKTIQNEIVQVIRNFQGILYVNTFVGKFFIQDLEHYNRKILSITTKEQIKQIEFRIKE